jgi:hypothetical protein
MAETAKKRRYRPTESQYKGGADEMYITYDREQKTSSGKSAVYPKVKRVYIAGDVKGWKVGDFKNRMGRDVHGVMIEYQQSRKGYRRQGFSAKRGKTSYKVEPASVDSASQVFRKIVEIPDKAKNVHFHKSASRLPDKYQEALQNVR